MPPTHPARIRVCQVVVAIPVDLEIVEAHERSFIVVVEDGSALQGDRIDVGQIYALVRSTICEHMQLTTAVRITMDVLSGRISLYACKVIGCRIEKVLPIVIFVVTVWRWTPFDGEQLIGLRNVARRLMNLKWQNLELFYNGAWSDDVEEAFIVCHKA
jgi:hypothetical protein